VRIKNIMANAKKVEEVKMLGDKLARAKALFITDYRGLTHQQLEALRKVLKKVDAEYVVAKNTLLKIAINESFKASKLQGSKESIANLEKELNNPTATLLAYGNEVAPIKELSSFIKTNMLPKVKIGIFGGNVATEADFKKLAALPTREVLLATLAIRLNGPIQGLHRAMQWNLQKLVLALEAVKGKKNIVTN